ncbi:MAG: pyridoxamine 5'-phosphate oxidase family protein [Thermodesulfobacteriota bacterium]
MTRQELETTVVEFMDSLTTMTLACANRDSPWAAAVYYARDNLDLIFFSSPGSRHSKVFAGNPRAAAAIHGHYTGWKEIKGLQMEGAVLPVETAAGSVRAFAVYLKKYPFVKEFFQDPGALSAQLASKMARVALYQFRPETILYLNNAEGFGTRWRLDVSHGRPSGDPVLVKGDSPSS